MSAAPFMPPAFQALNAERTIIGAVLLAPDIYSQVTLKPEDFSTSPHRTIWTSLARLEAAGQAADIVTLRRDLELRGELQAVGGAGYLGSLLENLPRMQSVEGWETLVREAAQRRAVNAAAERMQSLAKSGESSAGDALEEGMRVLQETAVAIGSSVVLDPAAQVQDALDAFKAAGRGAAPGWSTGIPSLDRQLGPLHPGLVIVAARTSIGKTALLTNIGENIAAQGGPVLGFSAEMTAREINARRLVTASGVPSSHFEHGGITPSARDLEALEAAAEELGKRPFFIEAGAPAPLEARAKARFVKARCGKLAAVLFDYLQLFPAGPGRKGETREAEVARVSRALKRLAMDLDVCVIAAAQLNRESEKRDRPRLSDLRESGSQEQDADIVLLLHRDEKSDDGTTEVHVAKHRHRGRGTVRLRFDGALYRFSDEYDS